MHYPAYLGNVALPRTLAHISATSALINVCWRLAAGAWAHFQKTRAWKMLWIKSSSSWWCVSSGCKTMWSEIVLFEWVNREHQSEYDSKVIRSMSVPTKVARAGQALYSLCSLHSLFQWLPKYVKSVFCCSVVTWNSVLSAHVYSPALDRQDT